MLVVGEKEMNEGKVSIRRQGKGDLGVKKVEEFMEEARVEIRERRAE
jgi:threonyl-tRNA synthetase